MPIYEYICDPEGGGCGHKFDEIQKFTDEPLVECPKCKADKLKKLVGSPSFQFRGAGFYETEYRRQETAVTED